MSQRRACSRSLKRLLVGGWMDRLACVWMTLPALAGARLCLGWRLPGAGWLGQEPRIPAWYRELPTAFWGPWLDYHDHTPYSHRCLLPSTAPPPSSPSPCSRPHCSIAFSQQAQPLPAPPLGLLLPLTFLPLPPAWVQGAVQDQCCGPCQSLGPRALTWGRPSGWKLRGTFVQLWG